MSTKALFFVLVSFGLMSFSNSIDDNKPYRINRVKINTYSNYQLSGTFYSTKDKAPGVIYSGKWEKLNSADAIEELSDLSQNNSSKTMIYEEKGHANQLFGIDRLLEGKIAHWFGEVLLK